MPLRTYHHVCDEYRRESRTYSRMPMEEHPNPRTVMKEEHSQCNPLPAGQQRVQRLPDSQLKQEKQKTHVAICQLNIPSGF